MIPELISFNIVFTPEEMFMEVTLSPAYLVCRYRRFLSISDTSPSIYLLQIKRLQVHVGDQVSSAV